MGFSDEWRGRNATRVDEWWMPVLWAVASFAIGIAAALAGLALLLPSVLRLGRRRQPRPSAYPGPMSPYGDRGFSARRQAPVRYEDDFDPDGLGEEDYQGAGIGYGGGYGDDGDRLHDNGTLDDRRRAGIYR
jgi:hypothetical protein